MNKILFYSLILQIVLIVTFVESASKPQTIQISVRIFDQLPRLNPNFQPIEYGQLTPGLVNNFLDPKNKIPILNTSYPNYQATLDHGMMKVPSLFASTFFVSNPDYNKILTKNITLTLTNDVYTYDNQTFFPINRQGWDSDPANYLNASTGLPLYTDSNGDYENFHFCMVGNMYFTYQGIEKFNFRGDDDVWVFINNELVVDLGGLHPAAEKTVNLQTDMKTKLVVNETYPFDFFYCERRTDTSTLKMQTNIEIVCPIYDYCGVCNGNGSSCCNATIDCDDGNSCTIDSCPSSTTPGITAANWKQFCTNTPVSCIQNDLCQNLQCTPTSGGKCVKVGDVGSKCPHVTCKAVTCTNDNSIGCQYSDLCTPIDSCHDVVCNNDVCSSQIPKNCTGSDLCMNYGCDAQSGCTSSKKNCANPSDTNPCHQYYCEAATGLCKFNTLSDSQCGCCAGKSVNPCQVATCDAATGICNIVDNPLINDNNPCTKDLCDTTTGKITNIPIPCSGCQNCQLGVCVNNDTLCTDGNKCSIDKCGANNTCQFEPINCDDNDPCTDDTCDPIKGCQHLPTVCPDDGSCSVGVCVKGVGCSTQPRNCSTGVFCTDSLCIESVGCVNFTRKCVASNPKCQSGTCNIDKQECEFENYSPLPFGCNKAAVISTGVIAGIVVAGAIALAIAAFAGKKGYDYWKNQQNNAVTNLNNNPLYTANPNAANNPLYGG